MLKKLNPSNQELLAVITLAAIQFFYMVDFVIIMPLGPVLIELFSITPAQFGLLVSSYNFSSATTGIIFSFFADQFERKKVLILATLGFTISTLFCAFSKNYETLLFARIITGAFGGILNASILTIISDIIPYERRGKAMGIIMSAFSAASVLGVPIGLALSDAFGWNMAFKALVVFSFIVILISLFTLPTVNVYNKPLSQVLKRYKVIITNKKYHLPFISIFFMSGTMFLIIPFLSPYAVKNMGIDPHEIKYMYLVGGLCTIATARIIGIITDKKGAYQTYRNIIFLSFIPIILYTHAQQVSFVTYIFIGALFMIFVSGRVIPFMTLVSNSPSQSDRGTFMSLLNSIRSLGSASMTYVAGLIISENSSGKLVHFNSIGYMSIILGLLTIYLAKKINDSTQN